MRTTLLLLSALLSLRPCLGQGAKAQADPASAIGQADGAGQDATPLRKPSSDKAAAPTHVAPLQRAVRQPANDKNVPTVQTLAQNMNVPLVAVPHAVASDLTQNGERILSNDQITLSGVYPNPSSSYSFVDYTLNPAVREARIVLYNVLGTQVSEYTLGREERKLRIATFGLESGFYYYTLFVDGHSLVTRRLVIKH